MFFAISKARRIVSLSAVRTIVSISQRLKEASFMSQTAVHSAIRFSLSISRS